jgi:secondary thiamine-phosphate synthase enzyme
LFAHDLKWRTLLNWYKDTLIIATRGKGLFPFTAEVNRRLRSWGIQEGICHLFIQHTSASLVINENYDPSARKDLESFFDHLAPEGQAWYTHTLEGRDDSPSHMRAILTHTSLSIPIDQGQLSLGTWQGIYLFEHRRQPQERRVLLRCLSVA